MGFSGGSKLGAQNQGLWLRGRLVMKKVVLITEHVVER